MVCFFGHSSWGADLSFNRAIYCQPLLVKTHTPPPGADALYVAFSLCCEGNH